MICFVDVISCFATYLSPLLDLSLTYFELVSLDTSFNRAFPESGVEIVRLSCYDKRIGNDAKINDRFLEARVLHSYS